MLKIVFVVPHPDDLEIFVGGQAIIYANEGHELLELLMTKGEHGIHEKKYQRKDITKIREDEVKKSSRIIGVHKIKFLGYLNHGIDFNESSVQHIKNELEKIKPDIVYAPEANLWKTYYPTSDHLNTGKIVREACKQMKKKPKLLLFNSLWVNRLVDITDVYEIKEKAISQHKTQKKLIGIFKPIIVFFARLFGLFNGCKYAEGFRKVKL